MNEISDALLARGFDHVEAPIASEGECVERVCGKLRRRARQTACERAARDALGRALARLLDSRHRLIDVERAAVATPSGDLLYPDLIVVDADAPPAPLVATRPIAAFDVAAFAIVGRDEDGDVDAARRRSALRSIPSLLALAAIDAAGALSETQWRADDGAWRTRIARGSDAAIALPPLALALRHADFGPAAP